MVDRPNFPAGVALVPPGRWPKMGTDSRPSDRPSDLEIALDNVAGGIDPAMHAHEPGTAVSVRSFDSPLGRVDIETRYVVRINGELFPDALLVTDDGTVHYHGLPQYAAPSAVELMKRVVDQMTAGPPPLLAGTSGADYHLRQQTAGAGSDSPPHDSGAAGWSGDAGSGEH